MYTKMWWMMVNLKRGNNDNQRKSVRHSRVQSLCFLSVMSCFPRQKMSAWRNIKTNATSGSPFTNLRKHCAHIEEVKHCYWSTIWKEKKNSQTIQLDHPILFSIHVELASGNSLFQWIQHIWSKMIPLADDPSPRLISIYSSVHCWLHPVFG